MKALIDIIIYLVTISIVGMCVGFVMQNDAIVITSTAGVLLAWAIITISLLIELINEYK